MKKNAIVKLSVFSMVSIAFVFYLIYYSNALASGKGAEESCFNYESFFRTSSEYYSSPTDSLIKTFNVKPQGSIYVNVPGADLNVNVWDRNEVKVIVYRKGSDDQLNNYKISFQATEDKIEIKAKNEKHFWNWGNFFIRFQILVPKQFYPDLNTSGGDIHISNLVSDSKIHTSGGDIKIENCTGIVNAGTSGGDIRVLNNNGNVNLETSGGDIDILDVTGKVSAKTSGGDITLKLNGDNNGIYLGTSGGDIKMKISGILKAELDCETSGGDVTMNGHADFQGKMKDHSIRGTVNGGGPLVKARTSGGDIVITLEGE